MGETQRPMSADELSPNRGVFQIMWKGPDGHLYVHQIQGDVTALIHNDADSTHLRESAFWHLKASFMSVAAAVYGVDPVKVNAEPEKPSPILNQGGKPYNSH